MTDKQLLTQLRKEFALFKKETGQIIAALRKENASLKERLAFGLEKHKYLFLKFIKQTHAQYFATIRGYISTIKKNREKVLDNIQRAFLENPYLPPISNG